MKTFDYTQILNVTLCDDGTVAVQLRNGEVEVYGYWKGKWSIEGEKDATRTEPSQSP